jgi:hypothetical protein
MVTQAQCKTYADYYQLLGRFPEISMQRATILMGFPEVGQYSPVNLVVSQPLRRKRSQIPQLRGAVKLTIVNFERRGIV